MHVHPDTHRVYNRGSILDDLDLLLIFCGGVITVFQKLPALSCNLAISSRVWKHCCPSVWAGGKMWLLDPTLSAEDWTEGGSKEVFHVWMFVLCCSLISSWGRKP